MYISRVIFNKIVRLVVIWNNIQRFMPYQTFSIDKTLLNSIFPITVPLGKYKLKPINSFMRIFFQISPQLTKKAQEWVYFYQSRILLLSLNTIYSLLLFFFRWFSVFICMLLERPPMISRNMCLSWRPCPQLSFCYKWQAKTRDKVA